MEPGRCSNLSAATRVCWYCVYASNLLGQFVVTIPAISIIPISVLSYNFMTNKFTDVLPDSLQFFKLVFSECDTSNSEDNYLQC